MTTWNEPSERQILKEPATESSSSPSLAPHPVLTDYYADGDQRQSRVDAMFDASAPHYDWIISMMSFGSGRRYRAEAMHRHGLAAGMKVLDVGSGTGLLALIAQETVGESGRVVAVDPSEGMLAEARQNGVRETVVATGDKMPLEDDQFDLLSMGYALRHVADLEATFAEYRRVLKPDGKVLLLEITRPQNRLGFFLLRLYLRGLVPLVTRMIRRSPEAQELMRYYWDTIENCVPPETILDALRAAGFREVKRHTVLGIFSEYTGVA
ncbi:MAG: methyltransferase domain-containing protein [Wenzhouxiangella sp.]|nr:MAG: methyltransferase domain-containing protein [Wenzhouxiangella sp.]